MFTTELTATPEGTAPTRLCWGLRSHPAGGLLANGLLLLVVGRGAGTACPLLALTTAPW